MNKDSLKFVITRDGSPTIYDPVFKEHHHSLIGAYTEARHKFAEVARPLLSKKERIKLLDLPFGMGYNLIASAQLLEELNGGAYLYCVAIEKDPKIIEAISLCPFGQQLQRYFDQIKTLSINETQAQGGNFQVRLIVDDLLHTLKELDEAFDLIYYDPFSPRVAPELWSKDKVLFHLARLMSDEALLITYTASNKVRKALLELGLYIAPGPAVGRKMGGTMASKRPIEGQSFSVEILNKIAKATPY